MMCLKAEDFEKKAHDMLDWLTDAERHLRYQGTMPDSEDVLERQLADHQVTGSSCCCSYRPNVPMLTRF